MLTTKLLFTLLALIGTVLAIGCDEDKRLVEFAKEADQRQAEQNQEIAHQNHEIAAATKQLVEADAKARQELVAMERGLQAERATVGQQRDQLEVERRQLASARQRESLLREALAGGATLLACLLPLVLCWYLLHGLRSQNHDEALGELLVMELAGDTMSPLLPAPGPRLPPDGWQPDQLPPACDTGTAANQHG
jgi:hypothetical protein